MRLQTIQDLYEVDGPVATVYLEARSPGEDARTQVRLRWEALRRQLEEAGAFEDVLSALDDAVLVDDIGEVQGDGRVLVAGREGVLLNEPWDASSGSGDAAHLTGEPELGSYVRARTRSVHLLVAVVDQEGAVLRREVAIEEQRLEEDSVDVAPTADESVHKPRGQALSHNQIQRRADAAVQENARNVAHRLESVAGSWRPDVLVLAGEVQGRTAVRAELSTALTTILEEVEAGGVDDAGAEEALADALREVSGRVAAERARQQSERLEEARARGRAVEGSRSVAHAANLGAVDTILLEAGRTAPNEGVLLAACARTDVQAAPLDQSVSDGVAAVLRFETPDGATGTPG